MDILALIFRYVHMVSAVVAVGGTTFIALCLLPATRLLDDTFRESLMKLVHRRFSVVLWTSIGGLTISGVYNWVVLNAAYTAIGPLGHALIGGKVVLALLLFALIWARQIGLITLTLRAHLIVAIHLAAAVILLGSILRALRLGTT